MGQSCSFVQEKEGNNLYREEMNNANVKDFKRKLLQSYNRKQQKNLRQVTFLESPQQLIYQPNDQSNTVVKLPLNRWNQSDQIQDIQIQQFLGDGTSFICKIKYYFQSYPLWKVVKIFRTQNLKSQTITKLALFYYSFYHIKQLQFIAKNFIHADKCSINSNKLTLKNHLAHSFIIQSQLSLFPFVPLRNLGFFMKFNNICWQDNQFSQIIKKCFHLIQVSKSQGTFIFQQWLIDTKEQISPIGTIVQSLNEDNYKMYLKQLVFYLCETLYGEKFNINSLLQLKQTLNKKQQTSKFKHPKSIKSLVELYEKGQISDDKQKDLIKVQNKDQKLSNIHNYIKSYRVKKRANQSSIELALFYIDFGEYQKAKQILYQKLYLLVYEQIGSSGVNRNKKNRIQHKLLDSKQLRKLNHKSGTRHNNLVKLHSLMSYLISLQRQLLSSSYVSQQLHNLLNSYLHLSLILSSHQRSQHNYTKSLQILKETKQFIDRMESWQLELHIALCHFYMGDFQEFQLGMERSIVIDKNEANICFMIMFYVSVLNWQKALRFIQQYQYLINEDYVYDLMISKVFLSKSLTITKMSQQQERLNLLFQTIKIASRVINRKNVPESILCQTYEIIADCYFYLKHFVTARQFYEKGLTICSSLQYNETKLQNKQDFFEPPYMRSASLQYTRSKSLLQSRTSSIHKNQLQSTHNPNLDHQLHQNSISRTRQPVNNPIDSTKSQKKSYNLEYEPTSFIYHLNLLFDFNKKAVLLTSIANSYFMENDFTQAIKFYQQAQSKVLNHNKDLMNSIKGNLALSQIKVAKNYQSKNQIKINQGKIKLQQIINEIKEQNSQKLQNDINYIYLNNQLNSI